MKKDIQEFYFRVNCMAAEYAIITLRHYGQAKQDFAQLEQFECISEESRILERKIFHDCIITITFAAMTLEAYLNDLAAHTLGDKLFYENFDMLRPLGKMQLIANFVLDVSIDKSGRLFYLVSELFKNRNELVHNKSKQFTGRGMTEEECREYEEFLDTEKGKEYLQESYKVDLSEIKEWIHDAKQALYALKEVGNCVNENSDGKLPTSALLLSGLFIFTISEEELARIKEIQTEIGVPTIMEVE